MSRKWLIPVLLSCLSAPVWALDEFALEAVPSEAVDKVLSPSQLQAAEEARQRQVRITNRKKHGVSAGRSASWSRDDLLQNPLIYRIDYGMIRRPVAVPFRMHRELP